ncbi:MAG TPA: serine/threonine-protein kinase [Polyangiaceae bacterium]|nr:serine/threonine-protein kinase [Polyangiaceae bacterium]
MAEQGGSEGFPPGTVLAGTPHRVRRQLGRGGVGTVYETVRLDDGAHRAVKVLSRHVAGNPALEERLVLEAKGLAAVRSPHIVAVHGAGRLATGEPFYEMDLLEGETLRAMLGRGPLAPSLACSLVYQALGALHAMHLAGLLHRDVKPDNLFLCADGRCVLLDFGAIKVVTDEGRFPPRRYPTGPGRAFGTTRYMPPEAGTRRASDARADVFAAGVVLAELLGGYLGLAHLDDGEYLEWVEACGVPLPYHLPEALLPVIERAVANDPAARYPSAEAFAAALGWACQDAGIDLVGVRPLARLSEPTPSPHPPSRYDSQSDGASGAAGEAASDTLAESTERERLPPAGGPAVPALEPSSEPEPPEGASWAAAAPSRAAAASRGAGWPRGSRRSSLVPAVALGAAGLAAGAAVSFAASLGQAPAAVQVAHELRPARLPAGTPAVVSVVADTTPAWPSAAAPERSAPPRSEAEAKREAQRARLEVKLKSGQGDLADAFRLVDLCQDAGDRPCLDRARAFVEALARGQQR